jgi:hypothetical protein
MAVALLSDIFMRIDQRQNFLPSRLEFFSLGGLLRIWWTPRVLELPWIVASALLLLLSCWDVLDGAGRMDFIVMGLAGYELVIGFTEEGEQPARRQQIPG